MYITAALLSSSVAGVYSQLKAELNSIQESLNFTADSCSLVVTDFFTEIFRLKPRQSGSAMPFPT